MKYPRTRHVANASDPQARTGTLIGVISARVSPSHGKEKTENSPPESGDSRAKLWGRKPRKAKKKKKNKQSRVSAVVSAAYDRKALPLPSLCPGWTL